MSLKYKISALWKELEKNPLTCECGLTEDAELVKNLLEKSGQFSKVRITERPSEKTESVLLCIDPHQLNTAWNFQVWSKDRGVSTIICFSMSDFTLIREAYLKLGSPHMVVRVGHSQKWNQLDFDLSLADFTESSFETIYGVLE